jgi:hypothetical protein
MHLESHERHAESHDFALLALMGLVLLASVAPYLHAVLRAVLMRAQELFERIAQMGEMVS